VENVIKHMEQYLSVIVFLTAASLLLYQTNLYLEALKINKAALSSEVMFEQRFDHETDSITYTELIATLFYDLEYDIQIDSKLISKYDHIDIHLISNNIAETMYIRSYAYDNNGNITRVIYQSMSVF
jgi:hypothetical protein